jgi:class 3 adenylate cyclase/pimeloyl-ACP methyl ester carboxylesterase
MTTQEVKRKLAAILIADVKGYSRLMGEDEKGTVRTLDAYKELMVNLIQQNHGRVVDAPGDNLLAEFASVVDAVECAVEIQKELKTRNAELPENRRMEFRIGVNLGDVIEDGEQILGDAVNIASRLESLADAGGICISGSAYDFVGKQLSLGYEYLGEHTVKNIEKAVRVYRVLSEPEPRHMEQQIRFCETADGVRIAYSTVGQGRAVVAVPGWISHLQLNAELPALRAYLEKMARNHTLVAYDKYGCGLSERSRTDFSLESELRPLEAVVDHLKLRRFALSGISQAGPVAVAYAVKHPRRVSHLILYGAYARGEAIAADELKVGLKSLIRAHWGMGSKTLADLFLPGVDEASIRWFTRLQREAATPEMAAQLMDLTFSINVVDLLPKVRVPTLVMHRRGDRAIPFQLGREMAAMIPGARFVQLEGNIHLPFLGNVDSIARTMAEFLGDPVDVARSKQGKTG